MANEPQPDTLLMILPECGGSALLEDGYVVNAPELVAEVAASSASIDVGIKLNVYRRNGVREYIVWRVLDRALDWFVLKDGKFERLPASAEGLLKSQCFPGFWLDPQALVDGDADRIWEILLQGIASPEHAAFVTQLQKYAGRKP
jgi:Uma2 family endonuclease